MVEQLVEADFALVRQPGLDIGGGQALVGVGAQMLTDVVRETVEERAQPGLVELLDLRREDLARGRFAAGAQR